MKQLTAKSAKDLKTKLFTLQHGRCTLCGLMLHEDMSKNHLDHDHSLDGKNAGKVRGLLHGACNRADGRLKNKFIMSGVASMGVDYSTFLRNLADYVEADYSQNDFHPQYIPDMVKKFKKNTLSEMKSIMESCGYEFNDTDTKEELVKKYNSSFRKEQKKYD